MRIPLSLAALLSALLFIRAGVARPLDTDDTGTAAAGAWELEGGLDLVRAAGADAWAFTPVLAYGLSERLQVDFGCDYVVELGEAGEPDARSLKPALQVKGRFWQTADGARSAALKANLAWPRHAGGARGILERHGHLRLLVTRETGATAWDFNAGYDFNGTWGGGDDAWVVSAGFRRPLAVRFTWIGEVFATLPERGGGGHALVATGAKWTAGENWTLDTLVGTGLGPGGADLRVILGFVRAL